MATRVVGSAAALAMVVVGCTTVTRGTATVDAGEAPEYRASVSASLEASAATSSARESERQQSLTKQAIHRSCDILSASSVDAIGEVNAYVAATNEGGDAEARKRPAVDALNRSADLVDASISDELAPRLRDALTRYVESTRAVARAVAEDYDVDRFNAEVDRLNADRSLALAMCDASY